MEQLIPWILNRLLTLPVILIALSVHELCHGYAAYLLGDSTAKSMGRLSLNPLKHIDPLGFLSLLFFRIGWAKPVVVNSRYFKNPKAGMVITSLSGPISNFVLAFLSSFIYVLIEKLGIAFSFMSASNNGFLVGAYASVLIMSRCMVTINLGLGVFNLIPIPPLDGSKVLYAFLPYEIILKIVPYENYIRIFLMIALCLGFLSAPISISVQLIENLFVGIARGVLF